jgi:hypothetical protein
VHEENPGILVIADYEFRGIQNLEHFWENIERKLLKRDRKGHKE